jgi:hypothetical protein
MSSGNLWLAVVQLCAASGARTTIGYRAGVGVFHHVEGLRYRNARTTSEARLAIEAALGRRLFEKAGLASELRLVDETADGGTFTLKIRADVAGGRGVEVSVDQTWPLAPPVESPTFSALIAAIPELAECPLPALMSDALRQRPLAEAACDADRYGTLDLVVAANGDATESLRAALAMRAVADGFVADGTGRYRKRLSSGASSILTLTVSPRGLVLHFQASD